MSRFTALVWFRRDLRLHDNPALYQATQHAAHVIPVYLHAPAEEAPWALGAASRWWLHHSLTALKAELHQRGSPLIVRQGDSLAQLRALLQETGARAVYWNRLYEPAVMARDTHLQAALRAEGVEVDTFNAALLIEPWALTKANGSAYQVFTPFWKACLQRLPPPLPLPAPVRLRAPSRWPASLPVAALALLPRLHWDEGLAAAWQPGEASAHAKLTYFCETLLNGYAETRDLPGPEGVSRLSPQLHFGELSPRQVWTAVTAASQGTPLASPSSAAYLRQLGWREFAHYVLYHWPHTPDQPLQTRFTQYPWRSDYAALLKAWQRGRTGYPLIDAGMRHLWRTGWMPNRVRMLAASFLVKNGRIPWQEGARWFWDTLVDADLANNTLGWQWTAGCGTDAAPYFRVFNPVRQGEQFDPRGEYVKHWVPELAGVPDEWLHRPWAMPAEVQQRSGFTPGQDYPLPVLDFVSSRAEALAGYERIKHTLLP